MGEILAICISRKRGTQKEEMDEAKLIENFGIEGDAHAGEWHRQVSILAFESIENFKSRGAVIDFGAFGENLIVSGVDFSKIIVGSRLKGKNFELEVTQIGKECHTRCKIYDMVGDCIMPKEGLFCRVITGADIKKGDSIKLV